LISVAVVDDQQLVREGLSLMLQAEHDVQVVLEAPNGREFLDRLDKGGPVDLVLLDLRMPVMDGIATLHELARWPRRPAVLVVTTFERDEMVLDAISAGADGYLLKRAGRQELVKAVRNVVAGRATLAPEVTKAVFSRLRKCAPVGAVDLAPMGFTPRETEILSLVGSGLNNTEIADRLILSPHTVKTHLTSILAKSGSRDRVQVALLAIRSGLADSAASS